jgi:hypothetical protein
LILCNHAYQQKKRKKEKEKKKSYFFLCVCVWFPVVFCFFSFLLHLLFFPLASASTFKCLRFIVLLPLIKSGACAPIQGRRFGGNFLAQVFNMAFSASKTVDAVLNWASRYNQFLILILIVLIVLYLWVRVPRGLPPCPKWVWPGFAHSLMVKGDLTHLFVRLRAEHGDVFSIWLGGRLVVVINGFQKIKEAFIDDGSNFSWRPDILNCDLFHYGKCRILKFLFSVLKFKLCWSSSKVMVH